MSTPSLYRRLVSWITRTTPSPALEENETPLDLGASYAAPEAHPTYDLRQAMSAYAGLPWVFAAMIRKSGDIAGLPLVVYRGQGQARRRVDGHPFYTLLQNPHPYWTERQLRRQLAIDKWLTGNGFLLEQGARTLLTIQRLHPARVFADPDPHTGARGWIYDGDGQRQEFAASQVRHVRYPSWEDGPAGLFGSGAILALHEELTASQRAMRRASEIAAKGRPDAVVSPKDGQSPWNASQTEAVKGKLAKLLEDGGVLAMSTPFQVEFPTWTPRDLEFEKLIQAARESTLAATGVPPHLVGLPSANYALAEAQERAYWEGLVAEAADFEDAIWNPLIRRHYGPEFSVSYDFGGVAVLQATNKGRLERVKMRIDAGEDRASAYAAEGVQPGIQGGLQAEAERGARPDRQLGNVIDFSRWWSEGQTTEWDDSTPTTIVEVG